MISVVLLRLLAPISVNNFHPLAGFLVLFYSKFKSTTASLII